MTPTIRVDDEVWHALKEGAEPFVDTPNDVIRRLLNLSENGAATSGTTPTIRGRKRLPSGQRTPETEFVIPILRAIEDLGGRAPVSEILDTVGKSVSDQLTAQDLESVSTGETRWRVTAKWARNNNMKNATPPLLNPSAPHGWWEITDAGRRYLEENS